MNTRTTIGDSRIEPAPTVNLIPNASTPEAFYQAEQAHVTKLNAEIDAQRDLLAKAAGDLDAVAIALGVALTPRETLVERCTHEIRTDRASRKGFLHGTVMLMEVIAEVGEAQGGEHATRAQGIRAGITEIQRKETLCPEIHSCVDGCRGLCMPDPDGAWPMPLACAFSDACPDGCRGVCQTTIGDAA